MIKRIISCVLVLLITLSSFPLFSFANEKNETSKLLVRQNQYKVIDVIKSGDEILMKTEDLAFLSAFVLKDEGHNAYFTRGAKTVFVTSPPANDLIIYVISPLRLNSNIPPVIVPFVP